jgi:hypothetical protein
MPRGKKVTKTPQELEKAKKERRDAFVKVAGYRVKKSLDTLDKLNTLANRRSYEFGTDDVAKIKKALMSRVEMIVEKFESASKGGPEKKETFSFD